MKMKRRSLNRTLFVSMFSLGILGILGSAYIWGALAFSRFQDESKALRKEYIETQKENVKQYVESAYQFINYRKQKTAAQLKLEIKQRTYAAHAIATYIYNANKDKLSKAEIGRMIHDALYPMSWDNGNGYYFAGTMQNVLVLNRNNPEFEGVNPVNVNNGKAISIMKQAITIARKKGEGYFSYIWSKPGNKDFTTRKFAFVKYFKPLDWFIGNGKYFEREEKAVQQDILKSFEHIKVGKEGYLFFGTYDGVSLSYPAKGKNVLELTDLNGKKIVKELIQKAKNGGGFVSYVMPGLGKEPIKNKLSYVMGIDDWQWYVGYGIYTDKIEQLIARKEAMLHRSIREQTLNSILLLLILLLIALVFARSVAQNVSDDFNKFSVLADRSESLVAISSDEIHFREFRDMAGTINGMLEESHKHNEENIQLQKKLDMAQKMEALGLMAGGVAHDLNNTLSAIINIPEFLLMDMKDDDPDRESIEMILDAGKRAAAIVKDMLTIGRGVVTKTAVEDVNGLIQESMFAAEFQELKSAFPDIEIEVKLTDKKLNIDCSEAHIKKMIYNLVNNGMEAIKDKGKIVISTSLLHTSAPITGVNEVPPGDYCLLEISDSGCGIPEEDLEKIFEPFYTKKELGRSGTGLGLAVVWNSVADHNAFIQVASDSSGTTFSIYFPLKNIEESKSTTSDSADGIESDKKRVIIVDDEKIQRTVLSKMIRKLGFTCEAFSCGEDAVEYLKKERCDLAMIDMMLGDGMNGRETYEEMLKINPDQKAVIVTGYAMNADVKEALKQGASGCLHKPYTMLELTEIVEMALNAK